LETLESRALLAFNPLPASGNFGGTPVSLSSDNVGPNDLSVILDDTTNPGFITATITTNDAVPQTRQYFNFSEISYLATNDTDGSVVNTVRLWTSYEADLAGYETAPADKSAVGLSTNWQVESRFPAGAATTSLLDMRNVDRLIVTSGVIGGGASTIAGEFESPTLTPADATKAAQITLNSGTRVTGANIGRTTALDPIVVYSLTITTQTGDVDLAADVFTVGDLSISAAKDATLSGLLQVEQGDITIESTSGNLSLGADTFFAHALLGGVSLTSECGTVTVQKVCAADDVTVIGELGVTVEDVVDAGGNITITAENGPLTVADLLAGGAIRIDAGKAVAVNGLVRASTGDIAIESVSDGLRVAAAAKVHAVDGKIGLRAARGPAELQNLYADTSIAIEALGDVSLNGTIQTTTGDLAVSSDGNIGNSARLQAGGSLRFSSGLNVNSLGGGIVRLELLSGGSNYQYAIVTIAPPAAGGGRAALARATITAGAITSLSIIDPGYGYAPNEQVAVSIEGNPATKTSPAATGAFATAFAGSTLSSMQAGGDLKINAGTAVDITNELRAEAGKVTVDVTAGTLSLSDIFSKSDVTLTASQTIELGGLVRTANGNIAVDSRGGGVDVGATLLAPAGGVAVSAAGQIVQRGGSVSRDRLFLLTGGRDYTYALVVVDPPPGAGQAALARAVITPFIATNPTAGGYISDIVLLDPGWGYPSDSRVNVSIQGDGEGATAVFATDIVTSSIDARDDVSVQAGQAITLVSSVRSSAGNVAVSNSIGDLAVQSVTSAKTTSVESARGKVSLVSVAAGNDVEITAFRGVSVTDSVNVTTAGDIVIKTTDGDLNFMQGLNFGDNYLVDNNATALQAQAVIATRDGSVQLRSENGSIVSPYVINATQDVTVSSFGLLELSNEIAATKGDVLLQSTSGLVQLGANVAAAGGSITIAAHTQLKQQIMSGVSRIQLLSPGEVVQGTAPQVTVTVASPRNGGRAASAVAVIERRSNGTLLDQDEYFIGSIAIIDAGQGYAVGESPSVTITGINGATARAFGPVNAAMLAAQDDIRLSGSEDVVLVTKIHSQAGDIAVESKAGDIELSAASLLLSAAEGAINVDANRGSVVLRQAAASKAVAISGLDGVTVLGSVVSEKAGIGITALAGVVDVRDVSAAGNVRITSLKSGAVSGEVVSTTGDVTLKSLAGGLFLGANVVSGAAIDLEAQTFILQDDRAGVERIEVINGGTFTGTVPPTVTVTIAAPTGGGVAARAQAVIGQRSVTEYFVESVFITEPGAGYARGELPEVTITGINGALARAFGPTNRRNLSAGSNVTIDAGDDISLANAVTATTGDIVVTSVSGDIEMAVASAVLNAVVGSVSLKADVGAAMVNAVYAGTDITIDVAEQVTLFGVLESDLGDIEVKSWKRDLDLTPAGARIAVDAGSATLTALNGSVLTPPVLHADGEISIRALGAVELRNEVTSNAGAITVESVSGGIGISGNVNAVAGVLELVAAGAVTQLDRGIAFVEVLTGGSGYTAAATVTIAPPVAAGGRAATARLVLDTVGGVSGVIVGITVIDPGAGYAVGEAPVVTIAPGGGTGTGGSGRAVVATGGRNLTGGTGIEITAGNAITLLNTVTATSGDVEVTSRSGDLRLGNDGFLARALGGSVSLAGSAGSVVVQRVSAVENVTLFGAKGVTVEGSVDAGNDAVLTAGDGKATVARVVAGDSVTVTAGHDVELLERVDAATGSVTVTSAAGELVANDIYAELDITLSIAEQVTLLGVLESDTGDVEVTSLKRNLDLTAAGARIAVDAGSATLTALNGTVLTPPVLQADGDVTIRGLTTIGLRNEVTSATGTISVESVSGGIDIGGNLNAVAGAVELVAQGAVTQSGRGVSYIEVLTGGSGYDASATVTIAAPAAVGGRAATGRLVLGTVGGVSGVILGITVVDPGVGYAVNESPTVSIVPGAVGGTGGTARAVIVAGDRNVAGGSGVEITAGGDVTLLNRLTAKTGDLVVASSAGHLALNADTFVAGAEAGGVTLTSTAGMVAVQNVTADDAVTITGRTSVVMEGVVGSTTGGVTVTTAVGGVDVHTILAAGNVKISGMGVVTLAGVVDSDAGDVVIASRSRDLDFTAAGAQLHAAVGNITLRARNGSIMSPPTLHAGGGVLLNSMNTLVLNNDIVSNTGTIELKSTTGGINLGANVDAQDGSVLISAKGAVAQVGGGVGFVRVVNGGSGYTTAATVTIAAPSSGVGQAARAVPVIARVNGVDGVITAIRLTSPGSGYGAGEQPLVTFARNAVSPPGAIDASATAVAAPALGNSGLAVIDVIDAGSGYDSATVVTIAAPAGGGVAATAQAVIGTVVADDGTVTNGAIVGIVIVGAGSGYGAGEQPTVTITGAGSGAIARAVANITLQDIRAGQNISVAAGTGVTLLNTIRAEQGNVSIASDTGNANLAARTLFVNSFQGDIAIKAARGAVTVQQLAAAGDIGIASFSGVMLLNAVNSTGDFGPGNVSIKTVNGSIAAVAPNGLISVQKGGVSLESVNGTVSVPQVFNVSGDVSLKSFGSQMIESQLSSSAGSITIASVAGSVTLAANLYAEDRVTLQAKTGINQSKGFMVGNELVARNESTGVINLASVRNDFANVALRNIGAVTYVDADEFETGIVRNPYSGTALGVEIVGDSVNLSSAATNSRIRVVSGLSYRTLSIAAGTQGGTNVGYVEYVTTSNSDNPEANAPFRGTLRDMIRHANDNTASYVNAANTRVPQAQAMVFDEFGYTVEEVAPTAALPAFARPVWFDGGRLEEAATATRLGIAGNSKLSQGLSFAASTPAVAGVRAATPGSAGSRIEKLAVYGFTAGSGVVLASGSNTVVDLHAGLRADGTVAGNMIGLDVRGTSAINNTIGEEVVDSERVNRFAGNTTAGIVIRNGAAGTRVFGSIVGDDTGKTAARANGDGIRIVNATRNQIGSENAVQADLYPTRSNVIAGNSGAGVRISSAMAGTLGAANVVRNNLITRNGTGIDVSSSAFAVLGGLDGRSANVITGQVGAGVVVANASNVQIQGNRIGIQPAYEFDSEALAGNGGDGVTISGKSQRIDINGGNWVGANKGHGISIGSGVAGVSMGGNTIGGELGNGSSAGNLLDGVAITAALGNTVGSGNVISRNGRNGVSITNAQATTPDAGNRVLGSSIRGNGANGVLVSGGSRTTIGGVTAASGNEVTSNAGHGIRVEPNGTTPEGTGHVIQGNFVGTNPAGDVDASLGNVGSGISLLRARDAVISNGNVVMNNRQNGVEIIGGAGNTVGGLTAAAGNQIRRNGSNGLVVGGSVTNVRVMGNVFVLNGSHGVEVGAEARDVRIGQIVTQAGVTGVGNTIRANDGWGVRVMPGAERVAVQGNAMLGNMAGALVRDGANSAAPGTISLASAGMRTATGGAKQLVLAGSFTGATTNQQYMIDVYSSPSGSLAGGSNPQGRRHIGRFTVTATANGLLQFNNTITAAVEVDEWITVTATTMVFNPGSTSAFSVPVKAALR
jgi:hypothetical protein